MILQEQKNECKAIKNQFVSGACCSCPNSEETKKANIEAYSHASKAMVIASAINISIDFSRSMTQIIRATVNIEIEYPSCDQAKKRHFLMPTISAT